jgi:hypothetical protein
VTRRLRSPKFARFRRCKSMTAKRLHCNALLSGDQYIINAMTNWERHQWARAGYPSPEKRPAFFAAAKRRREIAPAEWLVRALAAPNGSRPRMVK